MMCCHNISSHTGCGRRSGRDAYSSYTNTKQQQVMPTDETDTTTNLPQHKTQTQTKDLKTYASVGRADSGGGDDSNDGRELHC